MIVIKEILCFILILAILNIIREGVRMYMAWRNGENYKSGNWRTFGTLASIAYVITIIFCWF